MARVTFVKKARRPVKSAGIEVGDSYYWWANRIGRSSIKHYSKTKPTRSQTTMSSFYSTLWSIEDREFMGSDHDDLLDFRDELTADLEELKSECESNLDEVPDSLRDSHINNERIDELDSLISELEAIDFDDHPEGDGGDEVAAAAYVEWLDRKQEEISECSWGIG